MFYLWKKKIEIKIAVFLLTLLIYILTNATGVIVILCCIVTSIFSKWL